MAAANTELTAAHLRRTVDYDPGTGVFHWIRTDGHRAAGNVAGTRDSGGYLRFCVDNTRHRAHRLAWLYVHGVWPSGVIDHINGDKTDNRMANLRDVSHAVNIQNQRHASARSRTSVLGVYRQGNRFTAQIQVAKRSVHIGCFATVEEAHDAYLKKKRELHAGCSI